MRSPRTPVIRDDYVGSPDAANDQGDSCSAARVSQI